MKNTTIASIEELADFAKALIPHLTKKQILSLEGPMGVGKTTFVQALVEAMGGPQTSSPTFALHQRYTTKRGCVDHLDLYRLKNDEDLESIGFWDLFEGDQGLIVVEWGDRLNAWPPGWKVTRLRFEMTGPESRVIAVS